MKKLQENQAYGEHPDWVKVFPELICQKDKLAQDIFNYHSTMVAMKKGSWIFHEGDVCDRYYLLLEGSIRVQKISPEGRELMLYRFSEGEGCSLSAASLISDHHYSASAVCESHVRVVAIQGDKFLSALESSTSFRNLIYGAFSKQCQTFMGLISAVAFEPLNLRLARRLLASKDQGGVVRKTHIDLAVEMGSVREVVSRELNILRDKGWLELNRGSITIIDQMALSAWAVNM